jgi:hypothetical protein
MDKAFLVIAAVASGVDNVVRDSTPPSISSRLPMVGSRSAFIMVHSAGR